MVKGPKEKGVNNNLKKTSVRVRPFPGAIVKQLHHNNIPMLIDVTPDTILYCQIYWKSTKSLPKS